MLPVHQQANDATTIFYVYFNQLTLNYLFASFEQALKDAAEAEKYLIGVTGNLVVPVFYFYDSLIQLATYQVIDVNLEAILKKIETNQEKMQYWAKYAPMNFQHKFDLVEAEKHRILDEKIKAIELYEKAIFGAKENQYVQEEALANELAAKFYLEWEKETIAATYMQQAYYCYARWGAKAKTDHLEKSYPQLLQPILQQETQAGNIGDSLAKIATPNVSIHSSKSTINSTDTNVNTFLDFSSILKTSQTLSRSIEINQLLTQFTQIILQNSGASRCALILPNSNEEWYVEAIATPEETELCYQALENNSNLPTTLI
ncbi:MAG: histidine kinase, partial [Cyanobacteria bacterium J06641_2]